MTNPLQSLYRDHAGKLSDKWEHYLRIYDEILGPHRETAQALLEIGVQNGGSLEIWAKYFPNAKHIVGCDINPACAGLTFSDPRVRVLVGDVTSAALQAQIAAICPTFDVVIEDGSHTSEDIVQAFAHYFPMVADGGVFIAEDLHCSYWRDFGGGLHDPYSSMSFFKHMVDMVNHEHWGIAAPRSALIDGFRKRYGIEIEDSVLEQVHAVYFTNSICVVSKCSAWANRLGGRSPGGQEELVAPGHVQYRGLESKAPSQAANPFSQVIEPPGERLLSLEEKVRELERTQSLLLRQIQEIRASTSWRLTRPVRALGTLARKLNGARNRIDEARDARSPFNYAAWVCQYDSIDDEVRASLKAMAGRLAYKPLISIVMPTYRPNREWLRVAIESVQAQIYPHWELCIADDASGDEALKAMLEDMAQNDPRIKVTFRPVNGHISAASNSALELATGEWIALLDHDDVLSEDALLWVADRIVRSPDAQLIYSDEDKLDGNGRRVDPYFKPDWNIDLFYGQNFFCHLGVYRAELLRKVGGFRLGYEGAQDYDLVLRCIEHVAPSQICHIPRILYHWRVHPHSTAQGAEAKPYAHLAGERAVNDHFRRRGVAASATYTGEGNRVRYALPEPAPLVSIIIPTRNGVALLRQCIDSVLLKTTYPDYELIVVDNGSDEPATLEYLQKIVQDSRIRVLRDGRDFNYSALNNGAVREANGEVLVLLNNDIEVITPEWLTEMVSLAMQPGVGAVGAKLYYPDGRVQHAGVVLGVGGVAGHAMKYLPHEANGYFNRAKLVHSVSAVTAACLAVRKSHYEALGGLNEVDLTVAFNDVDFCLRLREAGLRNIWTPHAELFHHESATRGEDMAPQKRRRFESEVRYMQKRWGEQLRSDPAYNPNLTLEAEDFSLAWPPRQPRALARYPA